MIEYQNYLAIFDMDDTTMDPSGFTKPAFYHFKKIWVLVENYSRNSYLHSLMKQHLNLQQKTPSDFENIIPDIASGMLVLGGDFYYYPKLTI
jgi:hypothetical protein